MPNSIELFEEKARTSRSLTELEEFLKFLGRPPRYAAFRTKLVHSKLGLDRLTREWKRRDLDLRTESQLANIFRIGNPNWDDAESSSIRRRSGILALFPSSQSGIFRLTSVCYSTFWNTGVRRSVKRGYPALMPLFYQQKEFKGTLLELERQLAGQFQIVITDVGMKEPRPGRPRASRTAKFDTERLWTRANLSDLFAQAEERGQWFTSVGFNLLRRKKSKDPLVRVADGKLYKNGEFHINFLYSETSEILLPHLEKIAIKRINLLSNRGLRERNLDPAKPIQISYSSDVLGTSESLADFADILARYPNATKAVFHANPYYHASVADYLDGSSIDVWVLHPRRILLIPQAKSSAPAFGRLISHIFDQFQEGDVDEFEDTD